jgi:hypothetical protein
MVHYMLVKMISQIVLCFACKKIGHNDDFKLICPNWHGIFFDVSHFGYLKLENQ